MKRRTAKLLLAGSVLASGLSFEAAARPGGGSSFSGSSSRSSGSSRSYGGSSSWSSRSGGGGGGDGGDLFVLVLMVPFGILAAIGASMSTKVEEPWETGALSSPAPRLTADFRALEQRDDNFSRVLLEDFLFELYARAMAGRGDAAALEALTPYFSVHAREELASRGSRAPSAVDGVVVGRMDIIQFQQRDQIVVEYETNYTETIEREDGPRRIGFYALERWRFVRSPEATSPPPSKTLAFNCPSCGAPVDYDEMDACTHCGERNTRGQYAWRCQNVEVLKEETRPPTLTGYAPEVHGPDIMSPQGTQIRFDKLMQKHHGGDAKVFNDRVSDVYHGLNTAWSSCKWDQARSFLSDRLWLSWRYWVKAYEDQDLRNEMRDAELTDVQIAKVDGDPFFDVVVLRIYAKAIDVTTHIPSETVVGGNESSSRAYSEYWTFIRPTGRDGSEAEGECPNCGAPLEVEMAGRCSACRVKVKRGGDFDWVLSKVEQDESYRG